jgi:hypothetical protein
MKQHSKWITTRLVFGALLVAAIALWAFEKTTANLFVWDSILYLLNRENHLSDLNIENIYWMMTSLEFYNWHPVTWLSWAIDYQLYGGLDSSGYHFSNNILHAINSVLIFILTLVVFALNNPDSKSYPISTDNYSFIAAVLTAMMFAVHPQHVESVAWVAERKGLLCQLFMLLSILSYVKYVTCQENVKTGWFLSTLGLFSLALLSKPMAVTFPVILLLFDVYPLRRTILLQPIIHSIQRQSSLRLVVEKIPFLLLSAILVLVTINAQQAALSSVSFDLRILNAFNSLILYLVKLVVPLHFSPHYPYLLSPGEIISWNAFVPLVGFLGITLLAVLAWLKGHRAWMIAWLFYLITLSPVLGLIQVGSQGAADRYAYFPTLPAYMLMGAGILTALNHNTIRRFSTLLVVLCVVTLLALSTRQQVQVWQNPLTLWSQAVDSYPKSVFVRNNLAITHLNQGNYEIAAFHFEQSERLMPLAVRMLSWRGLTYLNLGRWKDALIDHVNLGVASETLPDLKVDQHCIQYNIGWLYAQMDMLEQAVELMGRVDPKSLYGPDAKTWLDSLENIDRANDNELVSEELPGFCKLLIPSRMRMNSSWQASVE